MRGDKQEGQGWCPRRMHSRKHLLPCRRDVQDELHANMSGSLPGPWKGCNQEIQYST